MKLREKIELEVKNTIGYKEAENKESFMVGVQVALSLAEKYNKNEIEKLERQSKMFLSYYETTLRDLKTVSNIVNRYSDN